MIHVTNLTFWRSLLLVVLASCTVPSIRGQIIPGEETDSGLGGNNMVQGTVLGPTGERIGRRIRLHLVSDTQGSRTIMTDDIGNFAIRGLPFGGYTLAIDKEKEFETYSQSFSFYRSTGPQTYYLNIRLTFKSLDIPKPEVINAAFAGVPEEALDHYKKAMELSRKRDLRRAIKELELAIGEYSKFHAAFNELGVIHLRLGKLEDAEKSFRSAVEIDEESLDSLTNLGITLVQMKKYADARPVLEKVTEKDGQSAVGHYFLGQALANLGEFDEGLRELILALELGGDKMNEARRILAIIYSSKGENLRAAAELETYLRISPRAADAKQLRQVMEKLRAELH